MKFLNPLQFKKKPKHKVKGKQKDIQCDTASLTSLRNKDFIKPNKTLTYYTKSRDSSR